MSSSRGEGWGDRSVGESVVPAMALPAQKPEHGEIITTEGYCGKEASGF